MEAIEVFKNSEFGEVRTVIINNEPYFVGKDVADILGYRNGSRYINRHVDEEDRHKVMIFDGNQDKETIIVNESGLYSLILSSKMPNARKFKHWVTAEVLPSIRKHGMYAVDDLLENPDLLIKVATELKDERQRRVIAEKEREELRQELDYSKEWYSIKRVAAMNGVSWKNFDWKKLKAMSVKLGIGVKENIRDYLTEEQLKEVQSMECMVSGLVDCGWNYDKVKSFIEQSNTKLIAC